MLVGKPEGSENFEVKQKGENRPGVKRVAGKGMETGSEPQGIEPRQRVVSEGRGQTRVENLLQGNAMPVMRPGGLFEM